MPEVVRCHTHHTTRSDGPEELGQAIAWDRRRDSYAYRAGLCNRCAATAAYGHQLGWTRVQHPPCDDCAPRVGAFPESTAHPAWRKHPRGRVKTASSRPGALSGVLTCPSAVGTFSRSLAGKP